MDYRMLTVSHLGGNPLAKCNETDSVCNRLDRETVLNMFLCQELVYFCLIKVLFL